MNAPDVAQALVTEPALTFGVGVVGFLVGIALFVWVVDFITSTNREGDQ